MAQEDVLIKQGTFVGDGTTTVTIPCDFYPDIIAVSVDGDTTTPVSLNGTVEVFIWRDKTALAAYDNNTSSAVATCYGNTSVIGMTDYNSASPGYRCCYATVTGSSVTIAFNTSLGSFASGYTFNYVFIKLPN